MNTVPACQGLCHIGPRETLYLLLVVHYKGYIEYNIKNTREEPKEDVHKGPEHRNVHPLEFGVCHPPSIRMHSPIWKLSEPHHLGL